MAKYPSIRYLASLSVTRLSLCQLTDFRQLFTSKFRQIIDLLVIFSIVKMQSVVQLMITICYLSPFMYFNFDKIAKKLQKTELFSFFYHFYSIKKNSHSWLLFHHINIESVA